MKKVLYISVFIGVFIFISLRSNHAIKNNDETRTVYINRTENGFELIRNGSSFYIRGASGNSYFKELADIGGNTIRVYDTINIESILKEAYVNNLAVIVDIPIPRYDEKNNFYLKKDSVAILKNKIQALVRKHKNSPALLMWNLGNELNYPFVIRKNSFINSYNGFIDIIHTEDSNHPVSTALMGVSMKSRSSIHIHSPGIDIISFNIFGNTKDFDQRFGRVNFLFGARPYYISEFGSDGYWESQLTSWRAPIEQSSTIKADQIRNRYNSIEKSNMGACLGSVVFFWGNKHEKTYTWFSLFDSESKSEIILQLENLWKGLNTNPELIGLNYMLVDGKGAKDNIVFGPNQIKNAELKLKDTLTVYKIKWEIYPEDWYDYKKNMLLNPKVAIQTSYIGSSKNKVTFCTPGIEGAYRIFAYVYDQDGYFATTNTPFYVLNEK